MTYPHSGPCQLIIVFCKKLLVIIPKYFLQLRLVLCHISSQHCAPLFSIVLISNLVDLSTLDMEVPGSSRGDATFSTRNFLGQGTTV